MWGKHQGPGLPATGRIIYYSSDYLGHCYFTDFSGQNSHTSQIKIWKKKSILLQAFQIQDLSVDFSDCNKDTVPEENQDPPNFTVLFTASLVFYHSSNDKLERSLLWKQLLQKTTTSLLQAPKNSSPNPTLQASLHVFLHLTTHIYSQCWQ